MPLTAEQHEKSLREPALCEQLPVRDYLDEVAIRTNGSFVAGYELRGVMSYFGTDQDRNRTKAMLDALIRSLPEQSMRLQLRLEVVEDTGELLECYAARERTAGENEVVTILDAARIGSWHDKERDGEYKRGLLYAYLIWDPRIHDQATGKTRRQAISWTLSQEASIERSKKEHEALLAEFETLLAGVETMMEAAELGPRRLTEEELFLEVKRALNPLYPCRRPYKRDSEFRYRSAREQIADVSIVDETESYLNVDGILYSLVSLKDLPDATFPGLMREVITLDFPVVVHVGITVPDQTKVLKGYKSRLRKMQAAQRDVHGGFRTNVEAQVSERQLLEVQQDIISSALKTVRLSLVIETRTSTPAITLRDLEEAERVIGSRRQRLLSAVARMNGAKAITETLAKRRLFFASLPGMAEEDKREHDLLSTNAADLLPVEMPWQGTPRSPLFVLETPYRQLIGFSPFDPSISDANVLLFAKTGAGKTMMAQMLLSMAARTAPLVSIIERGDSYRPLVELMGGQMVEMSLDSEHTINPWDLPAGEIQPSRDHVAFLKNLTRHMLGENASEDTDLLDNLITEAIVRTYKRAAIRQNPIPTFSDLMDELAQWRDEERNERVMDEARLASYKLRIWCGEKGVYSTLFDRPTTVSMDSSWLYFNVEKLSQDARLQGAMSLVIAYAMTRRASGESGGTSLLVFDEMWAVINSPVLGPVIEQLFRTARKRNGSIWAISHSPEDIVGTKDRPKPNGAAILKNASTKIIGQQPGDTWSLGEHIGLNETALHTVKHFSDPHKGKSADALIVVGEKVENTHTIRLTPTPLEYWIFSTYSREKTYRRWWMREHREMPKIEAYERLAEAFPQGLAGMDPLEEEISGEVSKAR